ncbi:hypothetical protein DF19_27680 [Streptomyces olindensis]|nr:hypothetical protein DF19_27680 [Streptomyces olindensis]
MQWSYRRNDTARLTGSARGDQVNLIVVTSTIQPIAHCLSQRPPIRRRVRCDNLVQDPVPQLDRESVDCVGQGHDHLQPFTGFNRLQGVLQQLQGVTRQLRSRGPFLCTGACQLLRRQDFGEAIQLRETGDELLGR